MARRCKNGSTNCQRYISVGVFGPMCDKCRPVAKTKPIEQPRPATLHEMIDNYRVGKSPGCEMTEDEARRLAELIDYKWS